MGISINGGIPLVIIHFRSGFSLINHPAIGVPPGLWKPPRLAKPTLSPPRQWAWELQIAVLEAVEELIRAWYAWFMFVIAFPGFLICLEDVLR